MKLTQVRPQVKIIIIKLVLTQLNHLETSYNAASIYKTKTG